MNKKAVVLALVLGIVAVLAVIIISLFASTVHESNLSRHYANRIRAFWLAEAGIAASFAELKELSQEISQAKGCPLGNTCSYETEITKISDSGDQEQYYRIDSRGEVAFGENSVIAVNLAAIVKVEPPDASKFEHAIETTGKLVTRGRAYEINGTTNEEAELNFSDLFGVSKTEMKENAVYTYDETDFDSPVSEITWVDVSSGEELSIAGNISGDGILVVSGDCHISGTIDFSGIIYVIGKLRISGNVTIDGTVLAESAADIDTTISGNVEINHDEDAIKDALGEMSDAFDRPVFSSSEIVAWQQN